MQQWICICLFKLFSLCNNETSRQIFWEGIYSLSVITVNSSMSFCTCDKWDICSTECYRRQKGSLIVFGSASRLVWLISVLLHWIQLHARLFRPAVLKLEGVMERRPSELQYHWLDAKIKQKKSNFHLLPIQRFRHHLELLISSEWLITCFCSALEQFEMAELISHQLPLSLRVVDLPKLT